MCNVARCVFVVIIRVITTTAIFLICVFLPLKGLLVASMIEPTAASIPSSAIFTIIDMSMFVY